MEKCKYIKLKIKFKMWKHVLFQSVSRLLKHYNLKTGKCLLCPLPNWQKTLINKNALCPSHCSKNFRKLPKKQMISLSSRKWGNEMNSYEIIGRLFIKQKTKNKKQVKPEEIILLNGKMVLVLGKTLHSNGGAEWKPNPFGYSMKLTVLIFSTPCSFLKHH